MAARDAAAAPPPVTDAPCSVLRLRAAEWSSAPAAVAAFEERVFRAASVHGRVLDVRLGAGDDKTRSVRVFFADAAAAVCCGPRFECNGVQLVGSGLANFAEPPVEAFFRDLPTPADPPALAADVGGECSEYGRVFDARYDGRDVVVTFASRQGAQAASVALDGAGFEGHRCAVALGRGDAAPACVLGNLVDDDDELDELSKIELIGELEEACAAFGAVGTIRMDARTARVGFDENRGAAACAAAMEGRVVDGREVTAAAALRGDPAAPLVPAELCAAVVDALRPAAPPPAPAPAAALSPEETLKRAINALRAAVQQAPRDADLRANLAGALTRVGGVGALEEACRHALVATQVKPDWAWGHYRLGAAHLQRGDVGKAAPSLKLAASLAPDNATFADAAGRADEAAEALLDPMDAYAARAEAEAKQALLDAEAKAKRERETNSYGRGKRKLEDDSDDEGELLNVNSRAHCYICKQWGHSKKDCPLARCQYCHEIGHRKSDCPLFTQALSNAAEEEKKARRKQGYEKKKIKRKEEWTKMLREQSGIDGFAALYRVLGLPERKLATAGEIKKAYHKRSLLFHPDKHPDDPEGAKERFLEVKAAYELLLEGMETGGAGMKGAVFSAGELTDASAASALQEKVKALSEKVKNSSAWSG